MRKFKSHPNNNSIFQNLFMMFYKNKKKNPTILKAFQNLNRLTIQILETQKKIMFPVQLTIQEDTAKTKKEVQLQLALLENVNLQVIVKE